MLSILFITLIYGYHIFRSLFLQLQSVHSSILTQYSTVRSSYSYSISGKRKKDYEAVFRSLKELLAENGIEIKAQESVLDFEAAVWKVMIIFIIII